MYIKYKLYFYLIELNLFFAIFHVLYIICYIFLIKFIINQFILINSTISLTIYLN